MKPAYRLLAALTPRSRLTERIILNLSPTDLPNERLALLLAIALTLLAAIEVTDAGRQVSEKPDRDAPTLFRLADGSAFLMRVRPSSEALGVSTASPSGYHAGMSNSDSVDVYELRYTKADMAAAPEAERLFYLMVTGLGNDIQILLRQYLIAVKQDDEDEAKRNASSAVAMLNLRLLAGRFHEGWVLVERRWPALSAEYEPLLSEKGRDALEGLMNHFMVKKTDNIVFMIRNKIGFHSDWNFAKAMFDATSDDTEMVEYLGQAFGDTLFFGSEVTHYATLKKLTGETDDVAAFGAIMDELRILQGLFLTFANAVVAVFARRNLKTQYLAVGDHKRTLTDLPPFDAMRIPFFADFSSSVAAVQSSGDKNGTSADH